MSSYCGDEDRIQALAELGEVLRATSPRGEWESVLSCVNLTQSSSFPSGGTSRQSSQMAEPSSLLSSSPSHSHLRSMSYLTSSGD